MLDAGSTSADQAARIAIPVVAVASWCASYLRGGTQSAGGGGGGWSSSTGRHLPVHQARHLETSAVRKTSLAAFPLHFRLGDKEQVVAGACCRRAAPAYPSSCSKRRAREHLLPVNGMSWTTFRNRPEAS